MNDPKLMVSIWEEQKKITNKHNDPGKFTTLIAFEWTSIPNYQNLHHNVFFRDDKGPDTQFSSFDSVKREDLWTYQEVQRAMGHENFSIPHNGNVSNGLMFATDGRPTARKSPRSGRSAASPTPWQPRSGRPRATPRPSRRCRPTDEFAGFETYYKHLLGSGGVTGKVDGSFVRQGLITGVGFQEMLGANPTSSASSAARTRTTRLPTTRSSTTPACTATPTRRRKSVWSPPDRSRASRRGSSRPRPPRPSGRPRTPARRSSTRSRRRRPTAPRAPSSACAFSAAGTIRPT